MSAPPQSGKSGSSAPPRWKRARRRSPPSRSWWSGLTRWRWRKLCALPEKRVHRGSGEAAGASLVHGREEVVFSSQDRERIGKAAVARANEMLAAAAAPDLPSASGKVGEILGKVVAGVSAIAQGTAMLSLSEETRPMRGRLHFEGSECGGN